MIAYAVYEVASGRIVSVGAASDLAGARLQGHRSGEDVILLAEGIESSTHYVVDEAIALRPVCPSFDRLAIAADGLDTARLDVGRACICLIDGVSHEVADGVIEITSTVPAIYRVGVRAHPYRDYDVEITACA